MTYSIDLHSLPKHMARNHLSDLRPDVQPLCHMHEHATSPQDSGMAIAGAAAAAEGEDSDKDCGLSD